MLGKSEDRENIKWSHFNQAAKIVNIKMVEEWRNDSGSGSNLPGLKFFNFPTLHQCLDIHQTTR